jgi:hypothetical protein
MPTFAIESNGRIEQTAIYYNGQQIKGIKEVFLNLDEEGTFDSVIQYEGSDKEIHTKHIFEERLTNVVFTEPSFSEEDIDNFQLQLLTLESQGDIDSCVVYFNDEPLDGIVSLYVHIKPTKTKTFMEKVLKSKNSLPEHETFKAEITFRNEDDSIETEEIF